MRIRTGLALLMAGAAVVSACSGASSSSGAASTPRASESTTRLTTTVPTPATNAAPAATGAAPAAASPASTASAPASTVRKVNANTASRAEIQAALEAAGVPAAANWSREVVEYRPYAANDTTWSKLRGELAKYNPGPGVVDQIVAVLEK